MKCKFAQVTHPDGWADASSREVAKQLGIGKSSVNDHRSGACACYTSKIHKIHKKASNVRVLVLDIETSPNLGYVWSLWKQNISLSQLVDVGQVICWAASWYGEDPMFMSDHHDGHDNMIQGAWDLLNEADVVVHYNGTSFDMPHLNREFALAGLTPPKPYKQIDLLRTVRKQFRFPSNKLQHVAEALGVGSKVPHTGFDLWRDCMADDPAAWALMREYNLGDIKVTEALFDRLRPWLTGVPHIGAIAGVHGSCPHCGSTKLRREGNAHANVAVYKAYRCADCGSPVRSTTRLQDTTGTRAYAA